MIFYEDTHEYLVGDEPYTSMTTFIHQFEPYTNWEKVAENYAKKNGYTAEYWLEKWDDNREKSAALGTKIHLQKEMECYQEMGWEHIQKNPQGNEKKGLDLSKLKPGLYPELIIYDHKFKIAGQADRVELRGNTVHIKDYKTSKVIDTEPKIFYDRERKRKIRKRLLPPVSHLDANNFSTYSLQLSGYAFILERWGYKVGTLQLIHLKMKGRGEDKFYDWETHEIEEEVIYDVPYLRREVQMMFLRNLNRLKID